MADMICDNDEASVGLKHHTCNDENVIKSEMQALRISVDSENTWLMKQGKNSDKNRKLALKS